MHDPMCVPQLCLIRQLTLKRAHVESLQQPPPPGKALILKAFPEQWLEELVRVVRRSAAKWSPDFLFNSPRRSASTATPSSLDICAWLVPRGPLNMGNREWKRVLSVVKRDEGIGDGKRMESGFSGTDSAVHNGGAV